MKTTLIMVISFAGLAGACVAGETPGTSINADSNAPSPHVATLAVFDQQLLALQEEWLAYKAAADTREPFIPDSQLLRVVDGRVLVDITLEDDADNVADRLRDFDATHVSEAGRMIACFFPLESLQQLAAIDGIRFVRAATAAGHGAAPASPPRTDLTKSVSH